MRYVLFCLLILFVTSCKEKTPSELEAMHDEVMLVHDEVMPKMRDINRAKKALRNIENVAIDSLISDAIYKLDEADEAMMSWMAQFKKPNPENLETAKAYYKTQMKSIEEVRDQMMDAIAKSGELIEKNQ